jgi:hypothetical protein
MGINDMVVTKEDVDSYMLMTDTNGVIFINKYKLIKFYFYSINQN